MADVRALLKAKRQEARVTHPLASYSSTGQLRCSACRTAVKHASAWEGHLGSKAHRTNVIRLREEENQREAEKHVQSVPRKRRASDESDSDSPSEPKRQKLTAELSEPGEEPPSSPSASATGPSTSRFPADFFSDASRAPVVLDADDEHEEDTAMPDQSAAPPSVPGQTSVDEEWAMFQQAVINAPDVQETYQRATVFAEAEIASETPTGFPPQLVEQPESEAPKELTEEEQRQKKAEEERELIMDRLLDEERAQEEADMKVDLMKRRVEELKKKRQAAKAARSKA